MPNNVERLSRAAVLSRARWFRGLPAEMRAVILDESERYVFGPHQTVVRAGEPGRGLWIVLSGQVDIAHSFSEGRRFIFHIAGPGHCCGVSSAVTENITVADLSTTSKTELLLFPSGRLRRLLGQDAQLYARFAHLIAERYARMLRYFSEYRTMSPEHYLRQRLAEIADQWREDGFEDEVIELSVSQFEAADLLGVSRQTLNRYLARMQDEKLVELRSRTICILDPEGLRVSPQVNGTQVFHVQRSASRT